MYIQKWLAKTEVIYLCTYALHMLHTQNQAFMTVPWPASLTAITTCSYTYNQYILTDNDNGQYIVYACVMRITAPSDIYSKQIFVEVGKTNYIAI